MNRGVGHETAHPFDQGDDLLEGGPSVVCLQFETGLTDHLPFRSQILVGKLSRRRRLLAGGNGGDGLSAVVSCSEAAVQARS